MSDDRLTTEDVARILSCTVVRARYLMGTDIKASKVLGQWLTTQRDVDNWLERHAHGGDLPPAPGKRSRPSRYPAQSP
jgi:hypothetical protein